MKKWTTKDGKTINIKDMSNNHLINSAKMIARNYGISWEDIFLSEFRKRKISIKQIRDVEEEEIDYSGWNDDFGDR
jgi:hypothetical protein